MKNKKGFTLIELIASIALILVLYLVVFPGATNMIQRSNKKHCETLIDELLTNAELYALDNNIKTNDKIHFDDLYNGGYVEDEYDFKNGFILDVSEMNNTSKNYITITRQVDPNDVTKGYNEYTITINNKTSKTNICK